MDHKYVMRILMISFFLIITAVQGWTQQKISISHALTLSGIPKYAEDFKHFDYA
ncbi:MAG: hypothetical protein HKO68_03265, partial [Desulfobacterales bacterium]|nr:hypothetical protein [Desulfobacterales bacterium]